MTTTNTQKPDDLGALAGQAQLLQDQSQASEAGEGAPQQEAPAQTNGQLLAGTLHLMRDVGCTLTGLQSPRIVLNDPTIEQFGNVWGAVADKRGWDLQKIMGDYAAEVAALMFTITIGMQLNRAIAAELAAREPKPEPAPAPPAEVVG